MRHPDQVLSKTALREHVWDYAFADSSNIVEVYVGLKRNEWKRWESAVTDWEQGEYARVY